MARTYETKDFLDQRTRDAERMLGETHILAETYTMETFLIQPDAESWSAAQVIEHLNSYSRYYLPAIREAMRKNPDARPPERYHAGWLGAYFARLMMPGPDGQVRKKMSSPRDHRPPPALSARKVLEEFWNGEEELLSLIRESFRKDIGAIRIPVSISPLIRLKLGDTLHFLLAHQLRHLEQVKRILPKILSPQNSGLPVQA